MWGHAVHAPAPGDATATRRWASGSITSTCLSRQNAPQALFEAPHCNILDVRGPVGVLTSGSLLKTRGASGLGRGAATEHGGIMGNRAGLVSIRQRRSLATSTSTDLPVATSTEEQRSGTAYPPRRMRAMVRMSHEHVRRACPWRARRKTTLRTRVITWRGRIALVLASERNDLRLALYANNRVHRAHGLQHRSP